MSRSSGGQNGELAPPDYFKRVRQEALEDWEDLEKKPHRLGPWHQLFSQVQNPRHVLSELLQNADDVGATIAEVKISDGYFEFSHNGQDFNEDQFLSLCRFGYSNKRTLFTIGFRGIGFKSTFSIGDSVDVLTPTLGVRFERERFTLPIWLDAEGRRKDTLIRVPIKDERRKEELLKNLQSWTRDMVPLLFFRNIKKLKIQESELEIQELGEGPIGGSRRVRLPRAEDGEFLVFSSPEEELPDDVLEEIKNERGIFEDDEKYPLCQVELILGKEDGQALYVVLPTSIRPPVPFSFNGPFIQDPSRERIKDPNISPTNRWLLNRVGRLAAGILIEWISNERLEPADRIDAYKLLPSKELEEGTIDSDCHRLILEAMEKELEGREITLSSDLTLHNGDECVSPPAPLYAVWKAGELKMLVGDEASVLVHGDAVGPYGGVLCEWDLAQRIENSQILSKLRSKHVPKPDTYVQLMRLWAYIRKAAGRDLCWAAGKAIKMIPVLGMHRLFPADSVIRLPTSQEKRVPKSVHKFLAGYVKAMDQRFLQLDGSEENETATEVLDRLDLKSSSSFKQIIDSASRKIFSQETIDTDICVRLAEAAAALDVDVPDGFCYAMKDDHLRSVAKCLLYRNPDEFESIFPEEWSARHFLNQDYFEEPKLIQKDRWKNWLISKRSKLLPFACIGQLEVPIYGREAVTDLLKDFGADPPDKYPYVTNRFTKYDWDFENELITFWTERAETQSSRWAQILEEVLTSPVWYWEAKLYVRICQVSQQYTEQTISRGVVPARWINRFRGLRCIPDEYGDLHSPSELLMRTSDTAALSGIERFVHPDLDQEVNRPLLKLLGVRDTPKDIDGVLARLRDLSKVEDPSGLISEISKWYEALARILARAPSETAETVRQAFQDSSLVLTHEMDWVRSNDAFRFPSIDVEEGDPVVHESFRDNPLWSHIGLPERPSPERAMAWLESLPIHERLEEKIWRRVRSYQQRYLLIMWERLECWLNLERKLVPIADMKYRLTMRALVKWSDLFPQYKELTADMLMLSSEILDRNSFNGLSDLSLMIEHQLEDVQVVGEEECPEWLKTLGSCISRIKDSDQGYDVSFNELGRRMMATAIIPSSNIEIVPYIDNAPAGPTFSPDAAWEDMSLYVLDLTEAKLFEPLVNELSTPFEDEKIERSIRTCLQRSQDFINEYFETNFEMEPFAEELAEGIKKTEHIEDEPKQSPVDVTTDACPDEVPEHETHVEPDESQGFDDEDDDYDNQGTEIGGRPQIRARLNLEEQYFKQIGFIESSNGIFKGPNNEAARHIQGPFNWEIYDREGKLIRQVWISSQSFAGGRIEIRADIWNLIRRSPSDTSIVLLNADEKPVEFSGDLIMSLHEQSKIRIAPLRYSMIWETE